MQLAAASVDDVAGAAGRAGAKAAGVVVDDTAVTPRYVQGLDPKRELPIIRRIAIGSLRNKLLFILPAALLLSQFLPWLLTPILMVGGPYLCYEGAEKIWEKVAGHARSTRTPAVGRAGPEDTRSDGRRGAIRTDFILSAEIMVIALNEVADEPFVSRAIILPSSPSAITVLVYGVVGPHREDGRHRAAPRGARAGAVAAPSAAAWCGRCRSCSPVLSTVGIVAMLWVGGHILLVGVDELGWHAPYDARAPPRGGRARRTGRRRRAGLARQHRSPRRSSASSWGRSSSRCCT